MKPALSHLEFSRSSLLTSGFGSLLIHLSIVLIASLSLRGCQTVGSGAPGGEVFREIGLVVSDGVDGGSAEEGMAPGAGDDNHDQISQDSSTQQTNQNTPADGQAPTQERLPSEVPEVANLLTSSEETSEGEGDSSAKFPALIGPGQPIGGTKRSAQGGGSQMIQPAEAGGASKLGGVGGPGDTTFMDVSAIGKTFVYVIDTSSSMSGGRLKLAQSQLKKSLRLLQPNQQFGVIFYNEYRTPLMLPRQGDRVMHFATEFNKLAASHSIDRIRSDAGTEHKAALLEALRLKPDVIYFLTDGDEPELSPADLREIAKQTGKTTIHVIKFGDSAVESRQMSWLEKLATQSYGEYRPIKAE